MTAATVEAQSTKETIKKCTAFFNKVVKFTSYDKLSVVLNATTNSN